MGLLGVGEDDPSARVRLVEEIVDAVALELPGEKVVEALVELHGKILLAIGAVEPELVVGRHAGGLVEHFPGQLLYGAVEVDAVLHLLGQLPEGRLKAQGPELPAVVAGGERKARGVAGEPGKAPVGAQDEKRGRVCQEGVRIESGPAGG